jgi:glycine cleavage system transcriptional repressor
MVPSETALATLPGRNRTPVHWPGAVHAIHSDVFHRSELGLYRTMSTQKTYLVISALGEDHPGLVNNLSRAILEQGCNIEDSRMTVLGGEFAAILLVEGRWNTLAKVENVLPELERSLGMTIISKRTGERPRNTDKVPYGVDVVAMDHPGIVNKLAGFFAERDINIEDMATSTYSAAHTGTPMFSVHITVGIPASTHIATLREEFMDYCDGLNLDAVLEPLKI